MTTTDRTFSSDLPPAEAWRALVRLRLERGDDAAGVWWLPGFECPCPEVETEPERRLVVRKGAEPCRDTTIVVTFEHEGSGSRITVTQSGFDPSFVAFAGEAFSRHAEHIWSDFELFFHTGVIGRRAWRPWADLGWTAEPLGYGLAVRSVQPSSWAERIGLRAGDVVLTLDGAPVFDEPDLALLLQGAAGRDEVGASWVSGGERRTATARL